MVTPEETNKRHKMKKSELKKIIKPLVKECISEVLLTEGLLASVIAEVVSGLNEPLVEQGSATVTRTAHSEEEGLKKLQETRKRMMNAVGRDAYGGIDIFEGTTPLSASAATSTPTSAAANPLANVDPRDPGVDISRVFGGMSAKWGKIAKGK